MDTNNMTVGIPTNDLRTLLAPTEYKARVMLGVVICQKCKAYLVPPPQQAVVVDTAELLEPYAKMLHDAVIKQQKLLCSASRLIYQVIPVVEDITP